jgi:uncharacterized protein (AIM24 family)
VTGESLFTTVYTNQGASGKQRVAFAAPYPGKILPMDLRQLGGMLICQKDAFLCAARGVSLGIALQQKLSVGFFGGEGLHHAEARRRRPGLRACRRHRGQARAAAGQTLMVDTGCVVAYTPSVNFEIQYVGKIKTALFGGEGLFFAKLTGPGTCGCRACRSRAWPRRVFAAAPQPAARVRRARCWGGGRRWPAGAALLLGGTTSDRAVLACSRTRRPGWPAGLQSADSCAPRVRKRSFDFRCALLPPPVLAGGRLLPGCARTTAAWPAGAARSSC